MQTTNKIVECLPKSPNCSCGIKADYAFILTHIEKGLTVTTMCSGCADEFRHSKVRKMFSEVAEFALSGTSEDSTKKPAYVSCF